MKKNKFLQKFLAAIISVGIIFIIWLYASLKIDSVLILPSPFEVLNALLKGISHIIFWKHIIATLIRVLIAFLISMCIGVFIGGISGMNQFFHDLFQIPLSIIRATPVVSFILLALFWFKSSVVPIFVSVLMCLPIIITSIDGCIRNIDKKLIDFSHCYEFSFIKTIKYIYIPVCIPTFANCVVATFGLSWKVVAAGEVLSLPRNAVGTLLHQAKVHLETPDVFAITLILIILCFIIEQLLNFITLKLVKTDKFL